MVLRLEAAPNRLREAMSIITHFYRGSYFKLEEQPRQEPVLLAYWRPDGDTEVLIGPVK